MKKNYQKPQVEVMKIQQACPLPADSITGVGGNVFDGTPQPGTGTGGSIPHSPGLDFDVMQDALFN